MVAYTWAQDFKQLYDKALGLYTNGNRDCTTYFNEKEISFLNDIGCNAQELYDFVEDWCCYSEPDYGTTLLITSIRRSYFRKILCGKLSSKVADISKLPSKTEAYGGVVWLPRVIEKARIKLEGEMHPDLMYGCGGDRKFFKDNHIDPADFLQLVWDTNGDKDLILKSIKH
ncbi:MAG: DUF5069 domain-containing protein [Verrucomicrobiota bacterium]